MEIATPFYHIVDRHQRYIKVMLQRCTKGT